MFGAFDHWGHAWSIWPLRPCLEHLTIEAMLVAFDHWGHAWSIWPLRPCLEHLTIEAMLGVVDPINQLGYPFMMLGLMWQKGQDRSANVLPCVGRSRPSWLIALRAKWVNLLWHHYNCISGDYTIFSRNLIFFCPCHNFFPLSSVQIILNQLVAYCVCFKMICKKSL